MGVVGGVSVRLLLHTAYEVYISAKFCFLLLQFVSRAVKFNLCASSSCLSEKDYRIGSQLNMMLTPNENGQQLPAKPCDVVACTMFMKKMTIT